MRIKYELPLKIDLGSGLHPKAGYTGIDILDQGQGIVWDVRKGIPLPDNSVEEVYSSHFVEHLENKDLGQLFQEMLRVCKDEAKIFIKCPHDKRIEAHYLCHYSLWSEDKVKGIVDGQMAHENGHFKIINMKTEGLELSFQLKVKKI